jgi:hypothetical protein
MADGKSSAVPFCVDAIGGWHVGKDDSGLKKRKFLCEEALRGVKSLKIESADCRAQRKRLK